MHLRPRTLGHGIPCSTRVHHEHLADRLKLGWQRRPVPKVPPLDEDVARELGAFLKRTREASGASQEDVAHRAGISRNHLQVIEMGLSDRASKKPFNPHLSVLLNMCRALDVSMSDVIIDVFGPPSGVVVEVVEGTHKGAN